MSKGLKILIGVLAAIVVLLAVNTVLVGRATKPAEVTTAGGRILHLAGGDMQVLERGPRAESPIVLLHCFTCSLAWWQELIPFLDREHRVVALDLRGFGGSEKPRSGYSIDEQAEFVAEALRRLGIRRATVVGQSLGGTVGTALAEVPGNQVGRLVIIDQAPEERFSKGLGFLAELSTAPVIGPALWRVTPDSAISEGLEVAFAPGFDVPEEFVDEFRRMTFTSYDSDGEEGEFMDEESLDRRLEQTGTPLLAIFGAEDQIYESKEALAAYATVPGAETALIPGAGHSPNVERPARTAALVLGFAR